MGINYSAAAWLCGARHRGICFERMLTIGRQSLFLSSAEIKRLARRENLDVDAAELVDMPFCDEFFKTFLKAKEVASLDCSDYEDCDIVHDMNEAISPSHHQQFDVVLDGGSLEHVFNFPVAVANCMKMVKVGGSFFTQTAANNYLGHGFYQFSPELFFRILQPDNGFEIQEVLLGEHPFPGGELSPRDRFFCVADPAVVKERVGLVSKSPVVIMVHAIRMEARPVFSRYPVQSDYRLLHERGGETASGKLEGSRPRAFKRWARGLFRRLPVRSRNYILGKRQLAKYSFSNRTFFEPWRP